MSRHVFARFVHNIYNTTFNLEGGGGGGDLGAMAVQQGACCNGMTKGRLTGRLQVEQGPT